MTSSLLRSFAASLLLLAACGRGPAKEKQAPAKAEQAPAKALDSVSASGRVTGGGMTMDVQLGAPVQPAPAPSPAPAPVPEPTPAPAPAKK